MKCKEIIDALDRRWMFSCALEWDNVGLLVGDPEKEIQRIYVALDASDEVIRQAADSFADLLVTHHPLIFSGIRQVTRKDLTGRRIMELIHRDICCCALHTNFDVTQMGSLNERMLDLEDTRVLEETCRIQDRPAGIGRVGKLPRCMELEQFAEQVKERLQIPDVRIYGDLKKTVRTAAVSGGSGKSMVQAARKWNADVLVTGDIDYHTGTDAAAQGLAIIDAGHYGTESVFISYMTEELAAMFPQVHVSGAPLSSPYHLR